MNNSKKEKNFSAYDSKPVCEGCSLSSFCSKDNEDDFCAEQTDKDAVSIGDAVSVHYTGRLEDGTIFDSSLNGNPLSFEVGAGQMILGFDKGVCGMKTGDKKEIKFPPEEGYGDRDPSLVISVPKDQIVSGIGHVPEIGTSLQMTLSTGGSLDGIVLEVDADTIKVDFNHRLAGKTLIFTIDLVGHVKKS